jgi:glycine betaine/proline transport system ATP-binding protein
VYAAIKRGDTTLEHALDRDVATVHPDDNVATLFPEKKYPVAVVDTENKLLGIVKRGSLLAAMAEHGGTNGDR